MSKVKCINCGHELDFSLTCTRCNHTWDPRKPGVKPEVCPKCKSPYWDRPRQRAKKNRTRKGRKE